MAPGGTALEPDIALVAGQIHATVADALGQLLGLLVWDSFALRAEPQIDRQADLPGIKSAVDILIGP